MGSVAKFIYEEVLPNIWGNAQIFNHVWGLPSVIYDFATAPSEFPYIWGKVYFLFYQCRNRPLTDSPRRYSCGAAARRAGRRTPGPDTSAPAPQTREPSLRAREWGRYTSAPAPDTWTRRRSTAAGWAWADRTREHRWSSRLQDTYDRSPAFKRPFVARQKLFHEIYRTVYRMLNVSI